MFGLVVNLAPKYDESFAGYLHRLGGCNGLWNGEVIRLFKDLSDELVYDWLSEHARHASWRDVSAEIRAPKFNNQKVWSITNTKYCPICMASELYWRELWDLTLYTVCTVHKRELLYRCPGCQAKATQKKILFRESCDSCGHPIITACSAPQTVDELKLWISVELEQRIRGRSKNISLGVDSLTLAQFHFLAIRVAVRALSCTQDMNMIVASKSYKNVVPELAAAAGKVLQGWPKNFHDLLNDLMALRESSLSWRLGSAFGRIYNDIYLSLTDKCYDFIRDEFEQYVALYWEGPLAMRNRRLSECTLLAHRWLPYKKAARAVGLPESFLRRMHASGELATREFTYTCGKTATVVDLEDARNLTTFRHEPLNLRETSRLLCLSRKRIEQLIGAEILKFVGGFPDAGEKWLIDFSSIEALAPKTFLKSSGVDFITISQAAKHYFPTSSGLTELVVAIKDGEIPVFCRAESESLCVGKWLVSKSKIVLNRVNLHSSNQEKGMSIANAAKELGVKEEVAYALVRHGRLRSETVQCSRRSAQIISSEAILHFKRNYILSPEIALLLDLPRGNVLLQLRDEGFSPVVGPTLLHAKCRQYAWRRSKKLTAYLASFARLYGLPE
ncbi:hypothetical protein BFW87_11390 [Pseudomonas fluorescens]|jgi:hypothetical protein|uniref:TniQ domain-containing protein n=1 Tax=Pseudomonas fluorescens TaxID=294 RepID=A0A1T2YXN0_PSEFL|nr:TniQ family protein [Pseudomonas fluorescens]OPA96915.1 hypothetical protein BFW87_11390 [Pseudomonas fluorescens]